jgi:glycosyltransferase involved in cell wall biosynthesis
MKTIYSQSPKSIGIFNDSFPPIMDGVSLTVENYAYWLEKKNQAVCVITPKSPEYTDHESYPIFRYNSLPILGRKPYRFGFPEFDFTFKEKLKKIPFGLVHAHCPFSSGTLARRISHHQKIPFVATFHSKYRDDFERSVHCKYIAKLMVKNIIKFYESADEVWIPQASVEETIREYGFKGKVEIVDNGNDFSSSKPIGPIKKRARADFGIAENETVFLFVGQHIWEKNTHLIIDSLALINDLPFKMFFVGTGYAAEDLKQLVDDLGLSEKVEFVGSVFDRDELKKYYAAADLFLFPSIYDNAPLVIREAAALHTPSVFVIGSSSAENIKDNINGFLTENSKESFSAKLRQLILSPHKIREAGDNASKTIARSWNSVTDEVLDRYEKLMLRTWNK